jgi:putative phosphoesterase
VKRISPQAIEIFKSNQVDLIIHAGDICNPGTIQILEEIAPVEAVKGNRDVLLWSKLPLIKKLSIEQVDIVVTHGHLGFIGYFIEKFNYILRGPQKFSHLENLILRKFPEANLIIYGHHHIPTNKIINRQLLFNPGSSCCPNEIYKNLKPSIGLIHINGKEINAEIKYLDRI